jgi:endonuclease/exonuclease/phosphatase family metal-dependent hydrolase
MTRRRTPTRLSVVIIATLSAIVSSFAIAPLKASAHTSSGVRAMTFNICGDRCLGGGNPPKDEMDVIKAVDPQVLLLQEVCPSQITYILAQTNLDDQAFIYKQDGSNGCASVGNAVLSKRALSSPDTLGIPVLNWNATLNQGNGGYDTGPKDKILCVRTSVMNDGNNFSMPLEACVTHLDNDPADASNVVELNGANSSDTSSWLRRPGVTQWEGAAAWAMDHAGSGVPLIFGGDFNLSPNDAWWDSEMAGKALQPAYNNIVAYNNTRTGQNFREVDKSWDNASSAAATCNGQKMDYLFFRQAYSSSPTLGAGGTSAPATASNSDHKMLFGSSDLNDGP